MIDLLMVLAFVVYAVAAGLRARRKSSRGLDEYFLAGRTLRSWQAGMSMAATQFAADTPLLAAGLVATGGVFALWRLWIYGIAFLLLGFLLARGWRRAGVVTDAEFCAIRYEGASADALRVVKATYYGLVFNCAVLAMVLSAAVRIAEPFLTWDLWLPASWMAPLAALAKSVGVPLTTDPGASDVWMRTASNVISIVLIYGFTLAYSTTGGLRGVVATDVVQLVIMFLGTGAYCYLAADAVGGFGALRGGLAEIVGSARASTLLAFDPGTAADVGAALLAVLGLQWLVQMNSDGTGYLAQRCMACRNEREAQLAPIIFAFLQVLIRSLLWLPIFVALLILYPPSPQVDVAYREFTFVLGIETLLPPGIRGMMLVGLLAALASTLDTHLNWGASYLSNDLYGWLYCRKLRRRQPDSRRLVWVGRLSNPALVVVSLLVMTQLNSIQEAWHITLLLGAGLGVPLLLRWFWHRVNGWGELAAVVSSAVASPIALSGVDQEATRLLIVAVVGTAACVAVSLLTPPVSADHLARFRERVRPMGFWGVRSARDEFVGGLVRLLASTGSLFMSLVGLGTWMVGGTAPAFLPNRGLWIAANLAGAVFLIPFWWPRKREANPPATARM